MKLKYFKKYSRAFIFSLLVLFNNNPSFAEELPSLFQITDKGSSSLSPASGDNILTTVNFSLLTGSETIKPADRMSAILPDRTVIIKKVKIVHRSEGDYSWFGKVEGVEFSNVILTISGSTMIGHISINGQTYSLDPDNGLFLITKNDESMAAPLKDDMLVPPPPSTETPLKPLERAPTAPLAANDGSLLDVLVLYTQAFEIKYSSTLSATIQNMFDVANTAYTDSGVNTQVRIVHSALYTDTGAEEGVDQTPAVTYITNDSSISTLRSTYKADLTTLMRVYPADGTSCGLAWTMNSSYLSSAFSVWAYSLVEVRRSSEGSGYYCNDNILAHEMGHNMGCTHDRANTSTIPAYSYSYGYGISGTFGTIMSYISPRIDYFSTPNINHSSGNPMGMAMGQMDGADCVSTFNNTTPIVAAFQLGAAGDLTAPTAVSVVINSGDATATSESVTLTLSATDDTGVTGYYASETNTTPSSSASGWISVTSATNYSTNVSFTLSSGDGITTVYVWFKDAAGNVSGVVSDLITLAIPPTAVSVVINSDDTSTASNSVTLSLSATDVVGVTGYYASETTPLSGNPSWISVTSATSYSADVSFTLSAGDETKTVYVWFKDAAGNVSSSTYDTIIYDTTKPTGNSVSINGGFSSTDLLDVTLTLSASDTVGVTGYYLSESSTDPSAGASGWVSVTSETSYSASDISFVMSSDQGTKTIYVWFKDAAGNVSTSVSDTIASTYIPTLSEWGVLLFVLLLILSGIVFIVKPGYSITR